ncbi:MAG: zinc-ribbon domain-containing protein [Clostridia bacterium]|nr:zinc-ribbon domain-containing protein [Clostridia bacterium]
MFCSKCGADNADGASFCKECGAALSEEKEKVFNMPILPPEALSGEPPVKKKSKAPAVILIIVGVIAAVFIIAALISGGDGRDPVADFKELVFEDYTQEKIGNTAQKVFKYSPSWKYEKAGDDHYLISVSGYYDELSMNVEAVYDLYYYENYVSANINHAYVNGQYLSDAISLNAVAALVCNNTDVAAGYLGLSILGDLIFG